ncbi:MAG: hypothetical protein QOD70_876 [Frankiales bacterium]|nr:hypothetical protein [Frankiales bacterium]
MTSHWRAGRLTASAVLGAAGLILLFQGQHPVRMEPPLTVPSAIQLPAPMEPPAQPAPAAARPVRLQVPALGIDSSLLALGQAEDGTVAVPAPGPDYDRAGWYRYSPTPGSVGPSVILGHVDSAHGGPSVFFRLGAVRVAEQVLVTGADGRVIRFTVRKVVRVAKKDFPTALVYGNTTDAELRLITCGGRFDHGTGHYLDNVIVFATLTP